MVIGDLADEAALRPPGRRRRHGHPRRRPHQGALASRVHARVNRDGTALAYRPPAARRALRPAVVARRARAAALGLCRQQARRPRSGSAARTGPWLDRPAAGRLRPGRSRDAGLSSAPSRMASRRCRGCADARLSLIHVADLADGAGAGWSNGRAAPATYEIDDGREGGYWLWTTWLRLPQRPLGRAPRSLADPAARHGGRCPR